MVSLSQDPNLAFIILRYSRGQGRHEAFVIRTAVFDYKCIFNALFGSRIIVIDDGAKSATFSSV